MATRTQRAISARQQCPLPISRATRPRVARGATTPSPPLPPSPSPSRRASRPRVPSFASRGKVFVRRTHASAARTMSNCSSAGRPDARTATDGETRLSMSSLPLNACPTYARGWNNSRAGSLSRLGEEDTRATADSLSFRSRKFQLPACRRYRSVALTRPIAIDDNAVATLRARPQRRLPIEFDEEFRAPQR